MLEIGRFILVSAMSLIFGAAAFVLDPIFGVIVAGAVFRALDRNPPVKTSPCGTTWDTHENQ